MILMKFLFRKLFGSNLVINLLLVLTSIGLLFLLAFCEGRSSSKRDADARFRDYHFRTLKDVNNAIDDLGNPAGDDLRCLLTKRGEIRDFDNLLCENGVISLNLPPVAQVIGARATRTTHPRSLNSFSKLFSGLFSSDLKVVNPYFWRTKKDVVEVIERLGFGEMIRDTRSCADVHNLTKMYSHCGRCSQCIDRRFAMLSADLEHRDPVEAYRVELLHGERLDGRDREIALSYVRLARLFQTSTPQRLLSRFGVLSRTLTEFDAPADETLKRITQFLARHGTGVVDVMERELKRGRSSERGENSLLALYGDEWISGQLKPAEGDKAETGEPVPQAAEIEMRFTRSKSKVRLNGVIDITGVGCKVLLSLAEKHLISSGKGLEAEDYELTPAPALMKEWGLANEEGVRKRVARLRSDLRRKFESAQLHKLYGIELIENFPWDGYRLNPDIARIIFEK
jgi:hypothetical protein